MKQTKRNKSSRQWERRARGASATLAVQAFAAIWCEATGKTPWKGHRPSSRGCARVDCGLRWLP
jgi:hypothetical protein